MAEPPRKSRRISSKWSRALHIEDNQEVHIPAQSNACSTAQSEGSDITEKIQAGIQAAIPDIANSVISALKVHGLTFPTTQCVNDTAVHAEPDTNSTPLQPSQSPLQNETTTYPVLNRPTGQRGNNDVANAETLHHFLNSGIDNIHDITRTNIGNSILQPITLEADLRKADNSVNYSRASISKPLALGIDPKIKTKIWALEYIDLGCLLNKKQSKGKFQPTETSEGGMAWEKQQPPTYRFENISHWLSAFHIFVSIYSEKYPKETGSLMKYADIIQNLARRSCDVAAYIYDRTYREWREHDYESLPWDQVNNELYYVLRSKN